MPHLALKVQIYTFYLSNYLSHDQIRISLIINNDNLRCEAVVHDRGVVIAEVTGVREPPAVIRLIDQ